MKIATIVALIGAVFVGALVLTCALEGCALHDPIPCQGEPYPAPCLARDAGGDR